MDARNALGLYKLVRFINDKHDVVKIHEIGIGGPSVGQDLQDGHPAGRSVDFSGFELRNGKVLLVQDDWGLVSVPDLDKAGQRKPQWASSDHLCNYRLDSWPPIPDDSSVDPDARRIFKAMYEDFLRWEYQD